MRILSRGARLVAGGCACCVTEVGLRGGTDQAVWSHAAREHYCLLSHDSDFIERASQARSGPKLIWFRQANLRWAEVAERLLAQREALKAFVADGDARILELI